MLTFPLSTSPLKFQFLPPDSRRRPSLSFSGRRRHHSAFSRGSAVTSKILPVAPASFYEVLRVKCDASMTEIKTAYRILAKNYHPDSADGSDGRDFIEINQAYAALSDPANRAVYDVSIGLVGGPPIFASLSFNCDSATGRRRFTRRWETDQCW